jgi:hypoxanthine-guanine phosphoribosyltransferase
MKEVITELEQIQKRITELQKEINGTIEGARLIVIAFELNSLIIPSLKRKQINLN